MADNQQGQANQQQIQVKIDPINEQGIYSNAVSVHVNQNEVILDFGYLIPNQNPMTIKLISRVNLSHQTAESFLNILTNAMLDWKNRQNQSQKK